LAWGKNTKKYHGNRGSSYKKSTTPVGNISKMLNPSRRIGFQTLQKMANVYDKLEFIRFVGQPVFVGSSIQAGSFSDQIHANTNEMNRTVILFYNHKISSKINNSSLFQFYC